MIPYFKVKRRLKQYLNPVEIRKESPGIIVFEASSYVSESYIAKKFPDFYVKQEKPGYRFTLISKQ